MTIEERIELHEQWVLSMESKLSRVADQQAVFEVHQTRLAEQFANTITQLAAALVTLAGRMDALARANGRFG